MPETQDPYNRMVIYRLDKISRLTARDARFVRRDHQAILRVELVEALPGGGSATSVRWLLAVAR